jgi:uncharacterized protein
VEIPVTIARLLMDLKVGRTMAKTGRTPPLEALAGAARAAADKDLPPVERWNPPDCGDIDMRIAADGRWYYQATPIARPALVKLFASVLMRDGERYCLVTPVEKCGIRVDDAPFLAIELDALDVGQQNQLLRVRTNLDDWVDCNADHPLRFDRQDETGGLMPHVYVRRGLWAKATRALFLDLVDLGEEREVDGRVLFGVASGGVFFAMAPADELRDRT